MSNSSSLPLPTAVAPAAGGRSAWRRSRILAGVMLGLFGSFIGVYFGTLPVFLLPIANDFGWGRADVSGASAFAMLGMCVGSPFVGRLIDRLGPTRVLGTAVLLFAALLFAMSRLPASVPALGVLAFFTGLAGSATTFVGFQTILPRWFDKRLGLALGLSGVGGGLGVALLPNVAQALIAQQGWRGAYVGLSGFALVVGLLAVWLVSAKPGTEAAAASVRGATATPAADGMTLAQAVRDWRFWVLMFMAFGGTFSILGAAIHGGSLLSDRGISAQQAAMAVGLGGLGSMVARFVVGVALDRFFAPRLALAVLTLGAVGLALNSHATLLPVLVLGMFLGGFAMGAEGDFIPYFVRRYFGTRHFGAIFGTLIAGYSLGGVAGPAVYGLAYDRSGSYAAIMLVAAVVVLAVGLALAMLGRYRYAAGGH